MTSYVGFITTILLFYYFDLSHGLAPEMFFKTVKVSLL